MTPVEVLRQLLQVNRRAAIFLISGISVFAAVAIVAGFSVDLDSAALTAAYVFAFAAGLYILVYIVHDHVLKMIIGWFVTLFVMSFVIVLSVSVVAPNLSPFPPARCVLWFWQACDIKPVIEQGLVVTRASDNSLEPTVQEDVRYSKNERPFKRVYSASTAVLDQLAVSERVLFRRVNEEHPFRFDPELASFYRDAVDPPGTAAFRRALDTVKAYNDLLFHFTSGQAADALLSKADALRASALVAGRNVSLAARVADGGGLAQSATMASGLEGVFQALLPTSDVLPTLNSRQEFRSYLIGYYPLVRAILLEVRGSTRQIFPVLTSLIVRRVSTTPPFTLTEEEQAKIESYRKLLSDWAVLIDSHVTSLDDTIQAIQAFDETTRRAGEDTRSTESMASQDD